MKLQDGFLYHIYNQSNSKKTLFKSDSDYSSFIEKMNQWLAPNCDMLAYCLMPNHFHLLVHVNKLSISKKNWDH